MTKKLEDLLNLPENKEETVVPASAKNEIEETFDAMAEFDKISAALPSVKGLGE